jgi:hypothetical protein
MSDTDKKQEQTHHASMSNKQLIGAGLAAVALIAILVIGNTVSGAPEAEMIITADVPHTGAYDADAVELDPLKAAGNEYDIGQMVVFEGELPAPLDEPVLGSANVVVEMADETVQSQSDETVPVTLVFADEATVDGVSRARVMGRYIGAVEIPNAIGGTTTSPAIQVDHLN